MRARLAEVDSDAAAKVGRVGRSWMEERCIGIAELGGTFWDMGSASNLAELEEVFATELAELGIDHLTTDVIRSMNRPVTQMLSRYIYENTECAGIRYSSRWADGEVMYAVLERDPSTASLTDLGIEILDPADPSLLEAIEVHGLHLHDPR